MGVRKYDASATASAYAAASSKGVSGFDWGTKPGQDTVHMALHPGYGGLRVCNDYPDMPALPISVMLDVTGSNVGAARAFYDKLGELMTLLAVQGWVKGARPVLQVLALDDYQYERDRWAQISPFEADGPTALKWIQSMCITSNGGGNQVESYEEMFWLLCHQNDLQAWKRGGKGYLFTLFDEGLRPQVSARAIRDLYGHTNVKSDEPLGPNQSAQTVIDLPAYDIPTDDMVKELLGKYEAYCMIDRNNHYYRDPVVHGTWTSRFDAERILPLDDPSEGVYMIAAIIGMQFGVTVPVMQDAFKQLSASKELVKSVGALALPAGTRGIVTSSNNKVRRL